MKLALLLTLSFTGCVFTAEPDKSCYYEATIGCGPGCTPRVVTEMIVCPNEPATPKVDSGTP